MSGVEISPYMVLGDFNARHRLWGDEVNNTRGNIIEKLISKTNISILNNGSPTSYHVQTNTYTCIDLSLCSPICKIDYDWRVMDDLHGSDHFPIIIKSQDNNPQTSSTKRWNTKRANWAKFNNLTALDPITIGNVNESIKNLNEHMEEAAKNSMPIVGRKRLNKSLPWWNDECSRAVALCKEAGRR